MSKPVCELRDVKANEEQIPICDVLEFIQTQPLRNRIIVGVREERENPGGILLVRGAVDEFSRGWAWVKVEEDNITSFNADSFALIRDALSFPLSQGYRLFVFTHLLDAISFLMDYKK